MRRAGDRNSVVPPALLPLVKDVPKSALKVKVAPADEKAQAAQSATIESADEKGVILVVGETAEGAEGSGGLPTEAEVLAVVDGPIASGSGTQSASPEEIHVDLPTSAGGGTGIVSRIAAYLPIPGALYNDELEAMTPAHEVDEPSHDGPAPVAAAEDKNAAAQSAIGSTSEPFASSAVADEDEGEHSLESPVLPFATGHHRTGSSSTAGPPGTPPRSSSTDVPRSRSYSALTALAGAFGGKSSPVQAPSSPNGRERAPRDPSKVFSSEEYNQQPDLVSGRLY